MKAVAHLRLLRTRLDEWAAQLPRGRAASACGGEPNHRLWWHLDATLTKAASGTLSAYDAWSAAVALLWAEELADVAWRRCARRHILVAAITGRDGLDGAAPPSLPALAVAARFQPQAWINDHAVDTDVDFPNQWTVSPSLAPQALRAILTGPTPADMDFLTSDPAAPDWIRRWPGPFDITLDYTIHPTDS
ncbi:hypothetical protein [Nocardia sp. NPDC047648]|uniref:hypothetical protein n=1 Tax=Nocardia sp. NPDC047648 TaxID=3155625 RepID=UPI0033C5DF02